MKFLVIVCLGILTNLNVEAVTTAEFQCITDTVNTKGKIKVTISVDVKPHSLIGDIYDDCSTGAGTSKGVSNPADILIIAAPTQTAAPYIYEFTVDTTKAGIKTACGVVDKTETNGDSTSKVTFLVKVLASNDLTNSLDSQVETTCNWKTDKDVAKKSGKITPSGAATVVTATKTTINAKLAVFSAETANGVQTEKTTVSMSHTCSVRVTVPTTGTVKRIFMKDLKASKTDPLSAPIVPILGPNGCGLPPILTKTDTFIITASPPADSYQIKTKNIPCFKYLNSLEIHFEVTVIACYSTTDTTCTPPDGSICTSKRRKRNVDSQTNNNTAQLTAMVTIVSDETRRPISDSQTRDKPSMTECLTHVTFLSVIIVLSILLLLTLGVTIFFGTKLLKNRYPEKDGYPNPSFKT